MKKAYFFLIGIFFAVLSTGIADDEPKQVILKETFDKPFPLIYKTIKKVFEDQTCRVERDKYQEDEKTNLFKGNITTEFCVFAAGQDTTADALERYSVKVPYIRGAVWTAGRIQYKLKLNETEDGKTTVELKGELSGFEEYVTNQTHFWMSNGKLEEQMMETIRRYIAAAKPQ